MTTAVADASVIVALISDAGERGSVAALAVAGRTLSAPGLLHYEVLQVLRRLEAAALITDRQAASAVADLLAAGIALEPSEPDAQRIWHLRHNLSAYDAAYVALAERLGVPLLTFDRRLARAPGPACEVIVPV